MCMHGASTRRARSPVRHAHAYERRVRRAAGFAAVAAAGDPSAVVAARDADARDASLPLHALAKSRRAARADRSALR
jgi:hypothetical protein